ncbi:ABC transporter ATP-binding protein [Paludibacterium paludis]|uniref:Cytochrome c biogenesis ATP-binding export protein CcmA n=1 Tax=Paludibacterium paludis TaxID=1225769 RepID=A0A918P3L7_9NEIS|nr:ATP-binding cassette domain-containing protein [Paludibacterium paludis]GGY17462.1 cytochrome c biogenesis ATP-binding export protein CcmA [Paludibacterium paludis]
MSRLELVGLSIAYPEKRILDCAHLTFEAGLVWLTGENGSGKSSALRTLAGALPGYRGTLRLNGVEEASHPAAYRRQLFFCDSDEVPLPWLVPSQWARLAAEVLPAFDEAAWRAGLDAFRLTGTERQPLDELSLGTGRKHFLALSFASGARLLLFDEPYNALDDLACEVLEAGMARALERGALVIVASHRRPRHLVPARVLRIGGGVLHPVTGQFSGWV